jgi:hypothetical protein
MSWPPSPLRRDGARGRGLGYVGATMARLRSSPAASPTSVALRLWRVSILLLVASVPFLNYADQPRRLIGAAATVSAFLMIRAVWSAQARRHDEIMRKLDAVAHPALSVEPGDGGTYVDEHGPAARRAAAQAAELFGRLQRDRGRRGG